jgi:peptidoglycan hydrolase-like protein with peptidoglycan-binding domain
MEERRKATVGQREQADSAARLAAEEAAQRKAEAEMAALRQTEAEAQRKAEAEAAVKLQADEALAKAQAERQRADAEAANRRKTEEEAAAATAAETAARRKTDDEAKAKADAEAKQKADADAALANEKKVAEVAETALRLAPLDRQRVQAALTSLGFDTRGSDGAFGPRSREMIASWQKARNQPVTGFLTAAQNQALLREAAPAISKFDDDQRKAEEEKKKAEEEKKKAEEAKAKAGAPAPTAPATPAPAPAAAAPAPPTSPVPAAAAPYDGTYSGTVTFGGLHRLVTIRVSNGSGSGGGPHSQCAPAQIAVSLTISPSGDISGTWMSFDERCAKVQFSIHGKAAAGQLTLQVSALPVSGKGTLARQGN